MLSAMQTASLSRIVPFPARPASPGPVARLPTRQAKPRRVLLPGSSAGEAFEVLALSCIDRFQRNEALLGQTGEPEALHQARVALRQLRSVFSIFAPILADARVEPWRSELRWLAATTNEARDLDVLVGQLDDPPAALTEARERAAARARRALASPRARKLMLELVEALERGVRFGGESLAYLTAAEFAEMSLDRLRRKVAKKGRHFRRLDDEQLHELRIAAKKLRYASEFFAALFPSLPAHQRQERFIRALRSLQDRLGDLQDLAVAPVLLERLEVPPSCWPRLGGRKRLVRRADAQFDRVLEARPFWT
jgi:CHAD domain-containing protein